KDMTKIYVLATDFLDIYDMITVFCFKWLRNLAFIQTRCHILEFFYQRSLPVHLHKTTIRFCSWILGIQDRLAIKTGTCFNFFFKLLQPINNFLLFGIGNFRLDYDLRYLQFITKSGQFLFFDSLEECPYLFWRNLNLLDDGICHLSSKLV